MPRPGPIAGPARALGELRAQLAAERRRSAGLDRELTRLRARLRRLQSERVVDAKRRLRDG